MKEYGKGAGRELPEQKTEVSYPSTRQILEGFVSQQRAQMLPDEEQMGH